MILVQCAMKLVGSRLGDHADLRSRGATFVGVAATGGHAELLNGVLGLAMHAIKRKATHLIVVIRAIDGHVTLIGTAAVDRAAAAIGKSGRQVEHTGLE